MTYLVNALKSEGAGGTASTTTTTLNGITTANIRIMNTLYCYCSLTMTKAGQREMIRINAERGGAGQCDAGRDGMVCDCAGRITTGNKAARDRMFLEYNYAHD